jgi:hypothetical protein
MKNKETAVACALAAVALTGISACSSGSSRTEPAYSPSTAVEQNVSGHQLICQQGGKLYTMISRIPIVITPPLVSGAIPACKPGTKNPQGQ